MQIISDETNLANFGWLDLFGDVVLGPFLALFARLSLSRAILLQSVILELVRRINRSSLPSHEGIRQ